MAAPSGTVWGSIAYGNGETSRSGRIGIYVSLSSTNTTTTATVQIWFWSKYGVEDETNALYFDNLSTTGSATTSVGTADISTTVSTGAGWSTSNQNLLWSNTYSYTRGTSAVTRYLYAKLTGINRVAATMYANATFTVPALASYTVSYNANGGSGAPGKQTKWYGETLALSSTKPTRTGYSFQGWATSASGSVVYASGANYTANTNATLYAVWKPNEYAVTYNANGGSDAPGAQTKKYGVTLKLSSTIPTRTNYNFKGWATSANGSVAYSAGGNYTANAKVTLYAVWELAYVKPRITDLTVARCTSDGTISDEGSYGLLSFTWACNQELVDMMVGWESTLGDEEQTLSETVAAGGTSGTVNYIFGHDALSTEATYSIRVYVQDESGYTYEFVTLPGTKFAIDFKAGGNGAAIGKPAELEGVFDIALQTRALGGYLYPVLEPETDLNDVRTPNTYTGANITDYNYENCPVTDGTFTLLVECCGEQGQVKQTYMSCSKYKPEIYSRFYYTGGTSDESEYWGDWFWASTDEILLYENSDGSSETINLKLNGTGSAVAASHYRYLEIYFTDNNGKGSGYTKVWNPSGAVVHLGLQEAGATVFYRQTSYAITGTTITPTLDTASYVKVTQAGAVSTSFGTNYIKIVRVVGRA